MTSRQYTETVPLPSDAPTDTKRFTHEDVDLAYSPTTGKCYRLLTTKWKLKKPGNCKGTYTKININGSNQQLHRIVGQHFMNDGKPLSDTDFVDHRKHADGSHEQDALINLRITNARGNAANLKNGSSRFAGVCWFARDSKWRADITINTQQKHLGLFHSEIEAAKAYIEAGEKYGLDMTIARERFQSIVS